MAATPASGTRTSGTSAGVGSCEGGPSGGEPAPVALALSGVRVVRGGQAILDGVDWTVRAGERWAVLGPNGAGKTTLLQVAGAAFRPTAGSVAVLGESVATADLAEIRSRVGLCSAAVADRLPSAQRALDAVLTAAYGLTGRGREPYARADDERARQLLAQLGCTRLVERRYGTLSEGERKRVQIARALMTDPEVLLLDEPAAGLDLGAREALLRLLARLVAEPGSPVTVLVTHHVEEIPLGITHALLLRAGGVVVAGPVEAALRDECLSACFGLPLHVERRGGRYAARSPLLASA